MKRQLSFRWPGLAGAAVLMLALFLSLFTLPAEVSAQTTPATVNITIQGFAFNPATITIPVGTKVIWTNKDSVSHTVTSDSGGTLSSPLIPQNTTFEFTFTTAGTFSYHCTPHPNMKANIIVTGGAAATTGASAPAATTAAASAPASTPVKAPATGSGGFNSADSQNPLLWLISLAALGVTSLLALAVRRRTHR